MRWALLLLSILVCAPINHARAAQNRVALVIGNDLNGTLFGNPARDAELVGTALKKIGFKLVGDQPLVDLKQQKMLEYVEAFGKMARDADIALFYFSGHGMQRDGRNYLVPIGLQSDQSIIAHTLDTTVLMAEMQKSGARVKVVLLDACRTPFVKGDSGLASMQDFAVKGTVIGFATQPNRTASPGPPGGNSPYAKALANKLQVKGLELYQLLNEVGLEVMNVTNNAQEPSSTSTPLYAVYLNAGQNFADQVSTNPELKVDLPNGQALRYIQNAHKLLENKSYAAAREILTEGIRSDPDLSSTYNYRGYAWYEEGLTTKSPKEQLKLYDNAFKDLDEAIRRSPDFAPTYRHRGNAIVATFKALKILGRPTNDILANAIKDLKKARELDPASKTNANALGDAYLVKGYYSSAIDSFNAAIAINGSYAAPYSGICAAYRSLGNLSAAKRYAQLAADRDSDLKLKPCLNQQNAALIGGSFADSSKK